jgi:hypothetical protein
MKKTNVAFQNSIKIQITKAALDVSSCAGNENC